jgi:hypothetical protein
MQTINAFQTVLSDDFSGGSTLAGNLGSPQIGTAWALYDSAWAASVKGRKLNGSFVTVTQGSTGNVTAVQKLNATPAKVEFTGQWDADSGSGAAGYFSVAIGSAIGTSQSAAVVNIKRDGMYFYKLDAGSATLLASESYSALTNGTSYTFTITYTDNVAINVSTLGNGDAQVSGPGGFNNAATFVSVNNNSNGTPRTANETRPSNMAVVWIMRVK